MTIAIVGASQAGLQIALSLRERGCADPVLLLGDESHPPYQRPPLSKAFLQGAATPQTLHFREASWYERQGITLVTGERVLAVDPRARTLEARSGRRFRFDRLAIATGCRARRLALPGADLPGVCYLRSIDDARELARGLRACARMVVIGGGFIGLETAAVAAALGTEVVVLEGAQRLLGRSVGPMVADFVLRTHRSRGLDIQLGALPRRLIGDETGVRAVELEDGRRIAADLVLVGIGSEACTDLARQLGLQVDGGVVVDSAARTSLPEVVAAGDCTLRPVGGAGMMRLESVHNAAEQARMAAASLLGQPAPIAAVPWFWSDQAPLKLQMAGIPGVPDRVVVRGSPAQGKFSVFYLRHARVVGAETVNVPGDHLGARKLIADGSIVDAGLLGDSSVPLKDVAARAAAA